MSNIFKKKQKIFKILLTINGLKYKFYNNREGDFDVWLKFGGRGMGIIVSYTNGIVETYEQKCKK